MKQKIKMCSRMAKMILNDRPCKIYVEKAGSEFVTAPGIDCGKVRVPSEQITVPLEDITRIFYEDRFGSSAWMEIAW